MNDFEPIRETYAPMVWSIVFRILKHQADALDCFQDVLLEGMQRGRRGRVECWGALLRWLATRRAIDHLRRRQRRTAAAPSHDVERAWDSAPTAEQQASFHELVERVRQELVHLPPRQAEAFWLVCVEQRSYEEVAGQMEIQANAVGVLVHRARQHLRTTLRTLSPKPTE